MTTRKHVDFMERSVEKTHIWLRDMAYAVSAAARVLRTHVSEGELNDVTAVLPEPIRSLFAERPTVPARPAVR